MPKDNQAEIEFWNGDAAQRWLAFQDRIDPTIRPYGALALDALASLRPLRGARVIDVGCGCGDTTRALAERVGPTGSVLGVDISGPMLARARERSAGLANVRYLEGDASTMGVGPADALFSRFGVMFFADPTAAFRHLRAQLVTGAPIAFVCWRALPENPWAAIPLAAVAEVVGPPPPPEPGAPGPFAFASRERVRALLQEAGFTHVTHTPHVLPFRIGASLDEAVEQASGMGPAARLLRDASEAQQAQALARLRERLQAAAPSLALDGAVWVVTARA